MPRIWTVLVLLLLALPNRAQVTDVTAFSEYSYLPNCLKEFMTMEIPPGLPWGVCSPWLCICSNEAVATSTITELLPAWCDPALISNAVAFVTDFCAQLGYHLPVSTTQTYPRFHPSHAVAHSKNDRRSDCKYR